MSKPSEKAGERPNAAKAVKPPEYRRFEKLLKQVLKAPPMRKHLPPAKVDHANPPAE
jgi:hypothetical protein